MDSTNKWQSDIKADKDYLIIHNGWRRHIVAKLGKRGPTAYLVFEALCHLADWRTGIVTKKTDEDIAKSAGVSEKTVSRCIQSLLAEGIITGERGEYRGKAGTYRLPATPSIKPDQLSPFNAESPTSSPESPTSSPESPTSSRAIQHLSLFIQKEKEEEQEVDTRKEDYQHLSRNGRYHAERRKRNRERWEKGGDAC